MQFTTFQSISYALWPYPPDWENNPQVELSSLGTVESSITAKESRRALAQSLRYSISFDSLVIGSVQSMEARAGLLRLKGDTVAVPMWTDLMVPLFTFNSGVTAFQIAPVTAPARFGTYGIIIDETTLNFEMISIASISGNTVTLNFPTVNTWGPTASVMPLLVGKFDKRPTADVITDDKSIYHVKVVENGSTFYALTPAPTTAMATVGAGIPSHSSDALWDIKPNWVNVTEDTDADIIYDTVGMLRNQQQLVYPQAPRRSLSFEFMESTRANIARVEYMAYQQFGQAIPFWVPTFRTDLNLAANLPTTGSPKTIYVTSSRYSDPAFNAHPGKPYLVLDAEATALYPIKIDTIVQNSPDVLTANQNITSAWTANKIKISNLVYCRFADTKITWDYDTDSLANATIKFVECTEEYSAAANYQNTPIYLYRITEQKTLNPVTWRYTSYERDVATGDGTYTHAPFSHASLKDSFDPSSDDCTLTTYAFSGNPIQRLMPYKLEGQLLIEILETGLGTLSTTTVVWTGYVAEVRPDGGKIQARCLKEPTLWTRKIPTVIIQPKCNWTLFSKPCGVSKASFSYSAAIISFAGTALNMAISVPQGWLVGGLMKTDIGTTDFEVRSILANSTGTGTQVGIQINRPFTNLSVGQTVTVTAGCDGNGSTCTNKFHNLINFGGFPFVPVQNPSLPSRNLPTSQQGKGGGK